MAGVEDAMWYYRALHRRNIAVVFVPSTVTLEALKPYKLLIVPNLYLTRAGVAGVFEAFVRGDLQLLVALALGDLPEEVPYVDVTLIRRNADGDEVLVDPRAEIGVAHQHEVVNIEERDRFRAVSRALSSLTLTNDRANHADA